MPAARSLEREQVVDPLPAAARAAHREDVYEPVGAAGGQERSVRRELRRESYLFRGNSASRSTPESS